MKSFLAIKIVAKLEEMKQTALGLWSLELVEKKLDESPFPAFTAEELAALKVEETCAAFLVAIGRRTCIGKLSADRAWNAANAALTAIEFQHRADLVAELKTLGVRNRVSDLATTAWLEQAVGEDRDVVLAWLRKGVERVNALAVATGDVLMDVVVNLASTPSATLADDLKRIFAYEHELQARQARQRAERARRDASPKPAKHTGFSRPTAATKFDEELARMRDDAAKAKAKASPPKTAPSTEKERVPAAMRKYATILGAVEIAARVGITPEPSIAPKPVDQERADRRAAAKKAAKAATRAAAKAAAEAAAKPESEPASEPAPAVDPFAGFDPADVAAAKALAAETGAPLDEILEISSRAA